MAISSEITSPNCHCICGRLVTYWRSFPGVTVLSLEFWRIIRDLDLTSYGWAYCEIFKDVGVRIRNEGWGGGDFVLCAAVVALRWAAVTPAVELLPCKPKTVDNLGTPRHIPFSNLDHGHGFNKVVQQDELFKC